MKTFRNMHPYNYDGMMPDNIKELISKRGFDGLSDSDREGAGWAQLVNGERILMVDGRILVKYHHAVREPNRAAVLHLANEREQKALEEGREITKELQEELEDQVMNEIIKYAPVKNESVYILICPDDNLLLTSASSAKKSEDACSYLRRTIETLPVTPWGDNSHLSAVITACLASEGADSICNLPENLVINTYGKTVLTGDDNSLKIILDGVSNNTPEARQVIDGMIVRSVEMDLVHRPNNGQLKNLASFMLHIPARGNVHLKAFDYDDDSTDEVECSGQKYITEMLLVAKYTKEILHGLQNIN